MKPLLIVLVLLGLVGCGDRHDGPHTSEEVVGYIASKHLEVEARLREAEASHPECSELLEASNVAAKNIRCGKCKNPVYPKGLPDLISNEVICYVCGARNFYGDPLAGVSVSPAYNFERYQLVGLAEEYAAREKYFKCIGWWK